MTLLQISEPQESRPGDRAPAKRKFAVGIDLGTTNSLVAAVQGGAAKILAGEGESRLLPSAVYYGADGGAAAGGGPVVGAEALRRRWQDPKNTITSVKRLMGRGAADDGGRYGYDYAPADGGGDGGDGMVKIRTAAGDKSPVEVSADILRALRDRALRAAGAAAADGIDGAVVTVPAYFDDAQRQATRDAAELAGLPVLRLLNEPTAAAVAYGLDNAEEGVYVVYDLGGGTFDLSVLRLQRGVFQVLATGGDTALGGDDYDRALAALAEGKMQLTNLDAADKMRLVAAAKLAKEEFFAAEDSAPGSAAEINEINFSAKLTGGAVECKIPAAEFSAATKPLTDKTLEICAQALRDADIGAAANEVAGVILVGGATRLPQVRAAAAEFFGRQPYCDLNPDEVVALGAAAQADLLAGNRAGESWLLLDVAPLSLGIETYGGLAEKIIHRNETIPAEKTQEFTTQKDGQRTMKIHVVQGERELVGDCRSLATFTLTDIPPLAAGAARIAVSFRVDADGLLSVVASERTSGARAGISVKPSYGLSEAEFKAMLSAAYENAAGDFAMRKLAEARQEGEKTLELLGRLAAGLSAAEREQVAAEEAALRAAVAGEDAEKIAEISAAAQQRCAAVAAKRLSADIAKTLAENRGDK